MTQPFVDFPDLEMAMLTVELMTVPRGNAGGNNHQKRSNNRDGLSQKQQIVEDIFHQRDHSMRGII